MLTEKQALVAFGANLPFGEHSPRQTVDEAMGALHDHGAILKVKSRLFKTPCFPKGAGPDYVNAAALLEVRDDMGPYDLLSRLHEVESRFGRRRETRWGMRTLDIDLLAMGVLVLPDAASHARWRDLSLHDQTQLSPDQLILPHPRMQDRAFVLVPLADIAPDWVHPVLQRSVVQMLADLPLSDRIEVRPIL
ncbi:MAG: 2-amino-4-hydroxy-6-hydroxymethyldihydropteridine diphosphokinase [Paracoccaceae bacterium]